MTIRFLPNKGITISDQEPSWGDKRDYVREVLALDYFEAAKGNRFKGE